MTFTATLSAAVQGGFTVDVSTADGTATVADGDYTAVSGQTLTFAGTSGETQTFTITPGADTKVEPNETVMIAMSNLTGASGTVDISDLWLPFFCVSSNLTEALLVGVLKSTLRALALLTMHRSSSVVNNVMFSSPQ